jgi:4-diphosphocytidyl-2-C-methyl-D-erythritol kinase
VTTITVRAHAKINLDLRVLATRADGYHELATVFQTIGLHDVLTLRPAEEGITIACTDPAVPTDRRNLVWRAVDALQRDSGVGTSRGGVAIDLLKRIPAEAGLGGGSSDAAAALVGVAALWGLAPGREELARLARELGADVPFFLWGGTALGLARGDELVPLASLPALPVVVARPPFGVATAAAFRWFDEAGTGGSAPARWPPASGGWAAALSQCRNDLEAAVVARHPEIGEGIAVLRRQGARLAAMSGSGSAFFGIFEDPAAATGAAEALASHGCVWRTATIDAAAHQASVGPHLVEPAARGAGPAL